MENVTSAETTPPLSEGQRPYDAFAGEASQFTERIDNDEDIELINCTPSIKLANRRREFAEEEDHESTCTMDIEPISSEDEIRSVKSVRSTRSTRSIQSVDKPTKRKDCFLRVCYAWKEATKKETIGLRSGG